MTKRVAVITGAGSGVGRAAALMFARNGWWTAIVGRRVSALDETIKLAGTDKQYLLSCPCDVSNPESVNQMSNRVLSLFERVDVLVNSAGTNIPKRSLLELSYGNYQTILETNLTGAYLCTQAFLPSMRQQQSGTIVNIISEAGKQASAKAGPAYVASKFGMAGLTQSINAEERGNGIRACAVFPGDIDTPILDLRPVPPSPEARKKMLQSEDVAQCIWFAINLPSHAIVEEILIRPR